MKSILISLALLFSLIFRPSAAYGAGILVLDENNFDAVLSQAKYVLVEFYTQDCRSCHQFAHEFAKAAQKLAFNTPRIKFFEVDASTETGLVNRYDIHSFPTTKLFISGRPIEYQGIWDAEHIIDWVKNAVERVSTRVSSLEELSKYITSSHYLVGIFFGNPSSQAYREFLQAAKTFDDVIFLDTNSEDLKKHLKIQGGEGEEDATFILLKTFDERKNIYRGEFTRDKLRKFIQIQKYPAVTLYDQDAEKRIFREGLNAIFLIQNYDNFQKVKEIQESFTRIAFEYKGEFVMTVLDFEDDVSIQFTDLLTIPLNNLLQVERSELPTLRLLEPSHGMRVYSLNGNIDMKSLRQFIDDFQNRRLEPFQSYMIPENL